jgi:hypothetical protein
MLGEHPNYDYCNCEDSLQHSETLKVRAKDLMLTPEEWCLRTGIRVVDPDGWNRKDYQNSWNTKIIRDDFLVRAASSTCMAWPSPLYDEKWKHEIHEPIKDVETMDDNQDSVTTPSSNPLLNILNDILKPKTTSASAADELMQAAVQLHNMFGVFVKAGFTESQALELVGKMLKS